MEKNGTGRGAATMSKTDTQRPCAMGRAVCSTAGLAGTLIRLTAGIAAVACLGYLAACSIRKQGKKEKMPLHPSRRGEGMQAAKRTSRGRQSAARESASRLSGRAAGRFPG